jgi:EpsI family protein
MDDYLLADFTRAGERAAVNFFAVYYNDQSSGRAVHSPRACIPAGGWAIVESAERTLPGVTAGQEALRVNRAVIQKGDARQVVYYWFQQRGRVITSEYGAKWFILLDSLRRSRTDGSLVRLVTVVAPGENLERADARLTAFAGAIAPKLTAFIPD